MMPTTLQACAHHPASPLPEFQIFLRRGPQWAKIAEKVHKPSLGFNVINFELKMGLIHGSLGVTQAPKSYNALIEVYSTSYDDI